MIVLTGSHMSGDMLWSCEGRVAYGTLSTERMSYRPRCRERGVTHFVIARHGVVCWSGGLVDVGKKRGVESGSEWLKSSLE